MTATVLATMRDEAPFILEWLAYHRVIGFGKFIIFSNDCTDGTDLILDACDRAGFIQHVPHRPDPAHSIAVQISAAVLGQGMITPGDWTIWLDADEFLNIHLRCGHIDDLIAYLTEWNARGMCVSWRVFGDGGTDQFTGRFLSRQFIAAAHPGDLWQNVKTFFRFDSDIIELFQHKPILGHTFWDHGGRFVSSKPVEMPATSKLTLAWANGKKRGKIAEEEAGWGAAQINHYAVRTQALYRFKQSRGRIGEPNSTSKQRYNRAYFKGMNINNAKDDTILRWSEQVDQEIARIKRRVSTFCDTDTMINEIYGDLVKKA